MENSEMHRVRELEGFAEAVDHRAQDFTDIRTERRPMDISNPEDKRFQTITTTGMPRGDTLVWGIQYAGQVGAKIIKALLLIFDKLDSIESLLMQQEMRERNKEGR